MAIIVKNAHQKQFYRALNDIKTTGQLAEKYKYHPRTIAHWCEAGCFACKKGYGKHWMISETSFLIFLRQTGRFSQKTP